MKQIGLGFLQYSQDYDECVPLKGAPGADGTKVPAWLHSIQPYVKSYQVLKCPTDTLMVGEPGLGSANTSYAINAIGSRAIFKPVGSEAKWPYFPPAGEDGVPVKLPSIEAPSTTVQVVESNNFEYYSFYADFGSDGVTPIKNTEPRSIGGAGWWGVALERHFGRTNVLWCDGHVKATKLDLLLTPGEAIPGTSDFAATYFTTKADPQ